MAKRITTQEEKITIVERHQNGESLPEIAKDLELSYYTTRKWWRIFRDNGWKGLDTQMGCKTLGVLVNFHPRVRYVSLRLKLEHPGWGLDVLRLAMSRRESLKDIKLPKRTALHNYLQPYYKRFRSASRSLTRRPAQSTDRPTYVHQRWQMDFKGYVSIKGVGHAMPFNVCDEFSSAPLQGAMYTNLTGHPLTGVTWRDIQDNLRQTFVKWGKPLEIKMDRDPLFIGSTRFEWPGFLLLWLIGLGITPIVNPKASPTKNANVERLNLTWLNHVGLDTIEYTPEELQLATDAAWTDRLFHLPSRNPHCNNTPPMIALPDLKHSKRYYVRHEEEKEFDIQKVYRYLAKWKWKRQIDTRGKISIGGYQKAISKNHIGQIVKVRFIPSGQLFQVTDLNGIILKYFTIPDISIKFISNGGTTSPN